MRARRQEPVGVGRPLRGLRRLSLASDRDAEMLAGIAARLDDLRQTLLEVRLSAPQRRVVLEESEVLRALDALDRVLDTPDLPNAAQKSIGQAKDRFLSAAGWQAIAEPGGRFDGTDIRIAEVVANDASGEAPAEARIHRVLEQGYRREDGTLLRPGVVVAAGAPKSHDAPLSDADPTEGPDSTEPSNLP